MSLFHTLLRLYPRPWRDRYEEEFTALLEQGSLSLVDVVDVALGALDAHLQPQVAAAQVKRERRGLVSKSSFVRWSGMAGMVGSVLVVLGLIGMSVFANEYWYEYDAFDVAVSSLFIAGVALTLIFVGGVMSAYGRRAGGLGQAGLLLALAGLLSVGVGGTGALADSIRGYEVDWWWEYFVYGLMGALAGFAVFGLAAMLKKALPTVGSRLAALGGFTGAAALVATMVVGAWLGYKATLDTLLGQVLLGMFVVSLVTFKVGLVLLGYALWSGREPAVRRIDPAVTG